LSVELTMNFPFTIIPAVGFENMGNPDSNVDPAILNEDTHKRLILIFHHRVRTKPDDKIHQQAETHNNITAGRWGDLVIFVLRRDAKW
jgi:hypothetical protein